MKIRRLSIAILFLVTNNTPVWAQLSEFERYEGSKEAEPQLIHALAKKFEIVVTWSSRDHIVHSGSLRYEKSEYLKN